MIRKIFSFALIMTASFPGWSQSRTDPVPASLQNANIEELMNVEVTSASRKEQRLAATAASVFVITEEDIRRSGLTSVPELLRMAPGVQVARISADDYAISIRGFNSEESSKLLVLVDGQSVYTNVFGGVYWDSLNVPVQDIEKIEVVRGPVAAMWGANAVNGVINIITKRARETQGALATAGGGSDGEFRAGFRYGDRVGSNAFWRISGQYSDQASYPIPDSGLRPSGFVEGHAAFRLDWSPSGSDSLRFSADADDGRVGEALAGFSLLTRLPAPVSDTASPSRYSVLGHWLHTWSDGSQTEVQASYQRISYLNNNFQLRNAIAEVQASHHLHLGSRHDVVAGLGYRHDDPVSPFGMHLFDAFVQDEFTAIEDRLSLVAGVRIDQNSWSGFDVQPTFRVLWTPADRLSSWVAVSRAVRTPSVLERYATGIVGAQLAVGLPALLEIPNANPTLGSEDLLAWEAGQRVEVSKTFSFDLSGFYQRYHHLITLDPGVPTLMLKPVPYLLVPLTQRNSARGDTLGGELAVNWLPHPRLQISGGYSWLGMRLYNAASVVGNSPTNQLQMRASFDLTRTLEVDGAGYMTGQVAMFNIPSYWRADARLAWHPRRSVEFAVNGQNLTSAEHPEYFSYRLAGIALIPRSVFGSVTWMR